MSESRNRYGYPTPALDERFPFGATVTLRTVAELRRYLDDLPGEWRIEGRGGNDTALRVELLPGWHGAPPLVLIEPVADPARSGGPHDY